MLVPAPHKPDRDSANLPEPGTAASSVDWTEARQIALQWARGLCKPDLAEDVTQVSMLRLMANVSKVRVGWKPLLRSIVYSVAYTALKKEQRLHKVGIPSVNASHDVADCSMAVAEAEEQALLNAALSELDERLGAGTQLIVQLRSRDVKWKIVAQAAGIPLRTCRYRLKAAMAILQQRFSQAPTEKSVSETPHKRA